MIPAMLNNTRMRNHALFILTTICLLCLLNAAPCQAFDPFSSKRLPDLTAGMNSIDVLKLWGPATDKIEYETSRRHQWLYAMATVTFKSGKVYEWKIGDSINSLEVEKPQLAVPQVDVPLKETSKHMSSAQQVLQEILKEIPSDKSESQDNSPSPNPSNFNNGMMNGAPGGYMPNVQPLMNAPQVE